VIYLRSTSSSSIMDAKRNDRKFLGTEEKIDGPLPS